MAQWGKLRLCLMRRCTRTSRAEPLASHSREWRPRQEACASVVLAQAGLSRTRSGYALGLAQGSGCRPLKTAS